LATPLPLRSTYTTPLVHRSHGPIILPHTRLSDHTHTITYIIPLRFINGLILISFGSDSTVGESWFPGQRPTGKNSHSKLILCYLKLIKWLNKYLCFSPKVLYWISQFCGSAIEQFLKVKKLQSDFWLLNTNLVSPSRWHYLQVYDMSLQKAP